MTGLTRVIGKPFHGKAVRDYCEAVRQAERKKHLYGLLLELEPTHPLDPYSIKVVGFADRRGWFGKLRTDYWHVGYVEPNLAREVHEDLLSRVIPIAAELYSIITDGKFIDISFFILAPLTKIAEAGLIPRISTETY